MPAHMWWEQPYPTCPQEKKKCLCFKDTTQSRKQLCTNQKGSFWSYLRSAQVSSVRASNRPSSLTHANLWAWHGYSSAQLPAECKGWLFYYLPTPSERLPSVPLPSSAWRPFPDEMFILEKKKNTPIIDLKESKIYLGRSKPAQCSGHGVAMNKTLGKWTALLPYHSGWKQLLVNSGCRL